MTRVIASTSIPQTVSFQQLRPLVLILALLQILILCRLSPAQTSDNAQAEQKVKKVFYSPKDRLEAMHAASLFTAKPVADANILEGPAQSKKEFQLHTNDKVICDFAAPGSQMGGKLPSSPARSRASKASTARFRR